MTYKHLTDAKLCYRVRKKLKMTQRQFGEKLGYSSSSASVQINRVERGKIQLTLARYKLLLMYAGESVPDKKL